MSASGSAAIDTRPVFFFDIDDCLYSRSLGVAKLMSENLQRFVMENLSLSEAEAAELNQRYYEDYVMTVVGLHKHHQIDPMVFNDANDNALPMDALLSPDKKLRTTLEKFDKSKVKLWLFTNAYVTHGHRVVKLLGVDDMFEGITYCDYANGLWQLKPHLETFVKAEKDAGASGPDQCYFVDDSPRNCHAASARGWNVVQILHSNSPEVAEKPKSVYHEINALEELHGLFPQFLR